MIQKLLIVLTALFLSACATPTPRADSLASDLDALAANVHRDGRPVILPNGKEYCAELARTEDDQDDCMGDLEDALYNSNRRGERQVKTVDTFIKAERLRRDPCGFWRRTFHPSKC